MILAIDVHYKEDSAVVAGILFPEWDSDLIHRVILKDIIGIAPYEPGAFYKRELPCILSLLEDINEAIETIIVDGFVTLGAEQARGLGMHLYDSLEGKIAVIGVAKKPFKETPSDCEIYRGNSTKPLFVTSAGIALKDAKLSVISMHGKHRNPTLLKRVDQLCRNINTQ